MKKILAFVLMLSLLCSYTTICYALCPETTDANDFITFTSGVITRSTIQLDADAGVIEIRLQCETSSAATYRTQAVSYIEKFVNGSWVLMTLNNGATSWENHAGTSMDITVEQPVTMGSGQYRVTTNFTAYTFGEGNSYASNTRTIYVS